MMEENLKNLEEYFSKDHYRYDYMAHKDINFMRYVEMEDAYRKHEFESSFKGMEYRIERDCQHLSLNAIITTGLFTDDLEVDRLEVALNNLARRNGFKIDVVALDEIYVVVYYFELSLEKVSWYEKIKRAIALYEVRRYRTLSKMNVDIMDVITLIQEQVKINKKEIEHDKN